jgi:hypothetical protein
VRLHAVSCVCAIFAVGFGLTAQAGELSVRIGSDNWHYAASELRFLQRAPFWGEESAEPTVADPLPALQQIAALAEDAGIQFLLVPVPPKALIYPEPIGLTTAQTVRSHALLDAFFAELRARGIHALDLRPTFLARRTEPALYARTDRHWSGTGLQCTAEAVARRLRERGWTRDPLSGVRRLEKNITFTGDLARRADSSRQETMPVTVLTDEAGLVYAPDPTSSVILMGIGIYWFIMTDRSVQARAFPIILPANWAVRWISSRPANRRPRWCGPACWNDCAKNPHRPRRGASSGVSRSAT